MNCTTFRKYVSAFADGELDVAQNLEALEHLNMCPTCAHRVNEVSALKVALTELWTKQAAPVGLREQIMAAISEGDFATPHGSEFGSPDSEGVEWTRPARRHPRLFAVAAILAAVVFYVAVWQFWQAVGLVPGPLERSSAQTVADIRRQHQEGLTQFGAGRKDLSGPEKCALLAKKLDKELQMAALVPNLARQGFNLIGGNACMFAERRGAQVLYRASSSGFNLSLFTLPHAAEFSMSDIGPRGHRRFFVAADDHPLAVIAWHEGAQTYAACSALPSSRLIEIFDDDLVAALFEPSPLASRLVSTQP